MCLELGFRALTIIGVHAAIEGGDPVATVSTEVVGEQQVDQPLLGVAVLREDDDSLVGPATVCGAADVGEPPEQYSARASGRLRRSSTQPPSRFNSSRSSAVSGAWPRDAVVSTSATTSPDSSSAASSSLRSQAACICASLAAVCAVSLLSSVTRCWARVLANAEGEDSSRFLRSSVTKSAAERFDPSRGGTGVARRTAPAARGPCARLRGSRPASPLPAARRTGGCHRDSGAAPHAAHA